MTIREYSRKVGQNKQSVSGMDDHAGNGLRPLRLGSGQAYPGLLSAGLKLLVFYQFTQLTGAATPWFP